MIKREYRYSDLTGKVIGCAMAVHTALGDGFQEVIYQRALEIEMAEQGLPFSREHEMPIYPESTDGRREDSGRGVRELQAR